MEMPLTSRMMMGIDSTSPNPKEAITKDWEGYLWQILLFPAATVCSSARKKADRAGGGFSAT